MASFTNCTTKIFSFLSYLLLVESVQSTTDFVYNGFFRANLSFYGASFMRSNGILAITNDSSKLFGHVFFPTPFRFKNLAARNNISDVVTFSTNFVFSIHPKYPGLGGHGLTFLLTSALNLKDCLPNQYLGLPNITSKSQSATRILAVEFDTPTAFYNANDGNDETNTTLILKSGDPFQAWIEYDNLQEMLRVLISPLGMGRPAWSLLTFPVDLAQVLDEYMYIGFSASTDLLSAAHNVHGWSFKIGERAAELDPKKLPMFPTDSKKVVQREGFIVGIVLVSITLFILVVFAAVHVLRRIRVDEILKDWEGEYGARRFRYSELYSATRGFREKNLVGSRGFGRVYKGVIRSTGLEVAVKRISNNSRQGMKEFAAEITSMGRPRHRNLVQLHGWCRRQDDLLLVYDYIPNGSLDKLLFDNDAQKKRLRWEHRYKILTDVAQALLYLHEECEQMVVHRDVKPSNILIDVDLSAKLGDFGLARAYDHGNNPATTNIVGTLGYMAPELTRTGKATTSTDVFSYGILLLEVVCGRRPIEPRRPAVELVLVDWVKEQHCRGDITRAVDPTLDDYDADEVALVLSLGLLCSHPHPGRRPSMRRVVQYLMRDANLPTLPTDIHTERPEEILEYSDSYPDVF
ncbi:hypothetical protein TIFTF001_028329 [Ficus carica]|uniref:non-specific serine/threonine protein kinase n=1 Tax=Ficus carica TaxID=3494 RepID=A0AA88J1B3_FICCA|nr:hypothetical protein TIFTF001_028329 [Ficus carica]